MAALRVRLDSILLAVLLTPLGVLLVIEALFSLQWRLGHDTSQLHYGAFLIREHGFVLYRDTFEFQFPGTFLFHMLVASTAGYSARAFMTFNLIWTAGFLFVTWLFMRRFGGLVALAAVLFFAVFYFEHGRTMMLQRDVVLLLPLIGAALVACSTRGTDLSRAVLTGLLVGATATVKPHAIIVLPVFVWHRMAHAGSTPHRSARSKTVLLLAYMAGAAFPLVAVFVWIWLQGGLFQFVEVATSYLPLYQRVNGEKVTVLGIHRALYLVEGFGKLGGHPTWLLAAVFGAWVSLRQAHLADSQRTGIFLLIALATAFSLYPVPAGKFWPYHWMPFNFFLILLASLTLIDLHKLASRARLVRAAVIVAVAVTGLAPAAEFFQQMSGDPPWVVESEQIDGISGFLKDRLQPGDRVQPLDWTGGALHAMLLTQALPATEFLYDFHFYHHVSDPYIKKLRARFIERLNAAKPRFIVAVDPGRRRVFGADTTANFPELVELVAAGYVEVARGGGYVIYERNLARSHSRLEH